MSVHVSDVVQVIVDSTNVTLGLDQVRPEVRCENISESTGIHCVCAIFKADFRNIPRLLKRKPWSLGIYIFNAHSGSWFNA